MKLTVHKTEKYALLIVMMSSIIMNFVLLGLFQHLQLLLTQPDFATYIDPAKALLQHHVLWSNSDLWARTPGYPLFIAFIFSLFGQHNIAISIVQILLSPLLIWNAFRIARFFTSIRLALVIAFIVAFDHLFLFNSIYVLTDYIFSILMSFVFYYSIKMCVDKKFNKISVLGLGSLLAVATLLRPIGYYLIILLAFAGTVYLVKQKGMKIALGSMLIFLLPGFLLVGGWQLRNKLVVGSYQYSSISSLTIYRYYAADVIAHREGISFEAAQARLDQKAKNMNFKSPITLNHYYAKEGLHILLSNPKLSILQGTHGFLRMMFGISRSKISNLFQSEQKRIQMDGFMRSGNFSAFYENLTTKYIFSAFLILFFALTNVVLFGCLLYFIYECVVCNNNRAAVIAVSLISFYFCVVSSNQCSYSRFKLPINLMFDVFGVLGLVMLVAKIKTWRRNAKAAPCYQ